MNKKLLTITVGLLLTACAATAQTNTIDLGYIGAGARPIAMGKAYTAVADDVNAVFLNPAGLGLQKSWGLTSMTTKLLDRVEYKMVGGVMPTEFGTVGIGYLSATTPAGYLTTDKASTVNAQAISYGSSMVILSYGRNLGDAIKISGDSLGNISIGANLKLLNDNFEGASGGANGSSIDLGLLYALNDNLSGGVSLQNVSGSINWTDGTVEKLPLTTKIGAAYKKANLSAAADIELAAGSSLVHSGVEYRPIDMLALRAGLDQTKTSMSDTAMNMSYGVGIKIDGFNFDYAYRQDATLGNNSAQYFSISFSPVIKKSAPQAEEETKVAEAKTSADSAIASQASNTDGVFHVVKKSSPKDILRYYE